MEVNLTDIKKSRSSGCTKYDIFMINIIYLMNKISFSKLFITMWCSACHWLMCWLQNCYFSRIYTAILIQIATFITISYRYGGSGPLWKMNVGLTRDNCQKNWWTNLLFINNYVNQDEMVSLSTYFLIMEFVFFRIYLELESCRDSSSANHITDRATTRVVT